MLTMGVVSELRTILPLSTSVSYTHLFVTLQLYGQSALLYLMYRLILRDKPEFDLIFQVSAYGSAPMLLCVIPVVGALTGLVWSLACTLVGYKTVLRLDWGQTLAGYAPVFLLEMFLLLQVMRMF